MLEDLQTKVIEEGKAEATTYDKFACFCKDMTDDKTDAITTGQTSVDDLTAALNEKTSYRAELDTEIEELNTLITTMEDEIKAAKEHRAAERAEYLKNKADVKDGISELDAAMKVLKMGQEMFEGESHMQMVVKTVRKAVLMADALNLTPKLSKERQDAIAALLQKGDTGLEENFVEEKGDMKHDEQGAQQEHDKLVLSKELL